MNSFCIGVCITIASKIILSSYTLFTLDEIYKQFRSFLNWLPFSVNIAFISGYLVGFFQSENNESVNSVLIVLDTFIIRFFAYCLEYNKFILSPSWENGNKKASFLISCIVFFASLIFCLIPYICYTSITKINYFYVILFGVISFLIYSFSWKTIDNSAEKDLERKLKKIILSWNKHSFSVFYEYDDNFFLTATRKELELVLDGIRKTLNNLYQFLPVSVGDILPGVKNNVVSVKRVKKISEDLLGDLLLEATIIKGKLLLLVGSSPEAHEGYDIAAKQSKEMADRLKKRRNELNYRKNNT
jgi:hypothetical protein